MAIAVDFETSVHRGRIIEESKLTALLSIGATGSDQSSYPCGRATIELAIASLSSALRCSFTCYRAITRARLLIEIGQSAESRIACLVGDDARSGGSFFAELG